MLVNFESNLLTPTHNPTHFDILYTQIYKNLFVLLQKKKYILKIRKIKKPYEPICKFL